MAVPPPPTGDFEGFSYPPATFAAGQNAIVTRSSGEESGCYILEACECVDPHFKVDIRAFY